MANTSSLNLMLDAHVVGRFVGESTSSHGAIWMQQPEEVYQAA